MNIRMAELCGSHSRDDSNQTCWDSSRSRARVLTVCLLMGVAGCWQSDEAKLSAQEMLGPPMIFQAPDPSQANDSGLTISAVPYMSATAGNLPIQVTLKTKDGRPLSRPRTLAVEVEIENQDGSFVQARQDVRIEEGTTESSTILSVPKSAITRPRIDIRVFERGQELEPLQISRRLVGASQNPTGPISSWLAVSRSMAPVEVKGQSPTLREMQLFRLKLSMMSEHLIRGGARNATLSYILSTGIHPDHLFDQWTAYSSFDGMVIALEDLQLIGETSPDTLQAINDWWRTGAILLVTCRPEQLKSVSQLEELLSRDGNERGEINWVQGLSNVSAGSLLPDEVNQIESYLNDQFKLGRTNGATVVLVDDDYCQTQCSEAIGLMIADDRYQAADRRGYGVFQADLRYNDWSIPDVGLPPVNTFRVLITVFVILIGPVNYFVLRRLRRLYLVLVTVPLGAMLVCLSLLAYAMLGDGLAVKSRVLSFSDVDQRSEHVVSWSRQSYYAPFMPTDGYRFPDDSEVLPVVGDSLQDRFYRWEARDGFVRIKGGNTGSRTTSQYLVTRSLNSDARLDIDDSMQDGNTIQVVNELGCEIELVGIVDRNGNVYVAERIRDGNSFTATRDSENKFRPRLTSLVRRNAPDYPEGLSPYYFRTSWRDEYVEERGYESAGRIGQRMQAILDSSQFEPSTYWVITRQSPTFVPQATRANETASFHVVFGRW